MKTSAEWSTVAEVDHQLYVHRMTKDERAYLISFEL